MRSQGRRSSHREICAINYDNIVKRKKAKLEELKRTAKHQSKVDEMQEIVDEMSANREYRIDLTLARFTDPRFRERRRSATDGAFLPLLGAKGNVDVAYAPVTNEEYADLRLAQVRNLRQGRSFRFGLARGERQCLDIPVLQVVR